MCNKKEKVLEKNFLIVSNYELIFLKFFDIILLKIRNENFMKKKDIKTLAKKIAEAEYII